MADMIDCTTDGIFRPFVEKRPYCLRAKVQIWQTSRGTWNWRARLVWGHGRKPGAILGPPQEFKTEAYVADSIRVWMERLCISEYEVIDVGVLRDPS